MCIVLYIQKGGMRVLLALRQTEKKKKIRNVCMSDMVKGSRRIHERDRKESIG